VWVRMIFYVEHARQKITGEHSDNPTPDTNGGEKANLFAFVLDLGNF